MLWKTKLNPIYLGLNFIRASKTNHDAMKQTGQPFMEWFKKQGVRPEIYYLSVTTTTEQNESATEGLESITKKLSVAEDGELWACCNSIGTKLTQMRSIQR
jgi:hypothetical protein